MRVRSLSAGPVPAALIEQIQSAINNGLNEFTASFPLVARQVALRPGCFGVMGSTP
jgi:hypothetical protein